MFWDPKLLKRPILIGIPPLMNTAAKMSFGEDLVKICPAIAEQSSQRKKEKQNGH